MMETNKVCSLMLTTVSVILLGSVCQANTCRSTCPETRIDLNHSQFSENQYSITIKCHLSCVKKYYENPKWLANSSEWPTYNRTAFDQNCYVASKVEQCQRACVKQTGNSHLNTKECREQCYSECITSCSGNHTCNLPNRQCKRKCRKPICRIGCNIGKKLNGGQRPVPPRSAPILMVPSSSAPLGQFYISILNSSTTATSTSIAGPANAVNFLFKVVDLDDNITWYYWQTDLLQVLNLKAFRCRRVEVSFAVVTNTSMSPYSPATRMCISDPSRLPSQVSNYTLHYSEDTRVSYSGYSVLTISWALPQDYSKITSYSFLVLALSSQCGGSHRLYQYNNIQPNSTHLTIRAEELNGFLKFGCTYSAVLEAHPTSEKNPGTHIQLLPTVTDQKPEMKLKCSKKYQMDGSLQVTLNWSILPASDVRSLEAIKRFEVQQLPYRIGGTVNQIATQTNKFNYTYTEVITRQQVTLDSSYTFLVRPLQNELYYWRLTPNEVSCTVSATPNHPPSQVKNVTIMQYKIIHLNLIKLSVHWESSTDFVTHYIVSIAEGNSSGGKSIVGQAKVQANQTSTSLEVNLHQNITAHCLSLEITAYRWFQASNASETIVLPRDSICVNSSVDYNFRTVSGEEGRITVYYEGEEDDATKLFDIGCSGVDQSTFSNQDIENRLASIEDKLSKLSHYLGLGNKTQSINGKLNSLNQKLDAVLARIESGNNS